MAHEKLSSGEAARLLGVTPQRVSQLAKGGIIDAELVDGRWLISREGVEERAATVSKKGGRPRTGKGRDELSFTLMNRSHEVCDLVYNSRHRAFVKLGKFADRDRAPIGVFGRNDISDLGSFREWWSGRGIPGTRTGIRAILEDAGVDVPDELVMRNLGLSLSDQYWIRPEGSGLVWESVNFFGNGFERVSEGVAPFTPSRASSGAHPDNTSDGNLAKRWVVRRGKRVLLKGGGSSNQEPFNEVVATALHSRLLRRGEFVPYTLEGEGAEAVCACRNFLTDREEFVPALYVDKALPQRPDTSDYQHYLRCCEALGASGAELALAKMIVCDDVLANEDRHYRNFGLVRDVETLACRPAPIFDSGSCLWVSKTLAELERGDGGFRSKQFEPSPARQLLLVEDMSWFDAADLDGFADEAIAILSANKLLEERVPHIKTLLERRIARMVDIRLWSVSSKHNGEGGAAARQ